MSFDSKIFWHKTDEFNREMINGARRGGRTLKNKLNELQIVYLIILIKRFSQEN